MKILELVTKVETLSMQEIDELVKVGIQIEDIEYLLVHDNENMRQTLFKNENLKQFLLKEINKFAEKLFYEINKEPKRELSEDIKKECEIYMRTYYKECVELDIGKTIGDSIVSLIMQLKSKNPFFSEIYKEHKVWKQYCEVIRNISKKDVSSMSKEQLIQTDKIFAYFFSRIIAGYNMIEAETALKIIQREEFDITSFTSLDQFKQIYQREINNPNSQMVRKDEVFSLALDYDILLKNKGIQKERQYSPIAEMTQAIKDGTFGKDNILSKEETAFAIKMLQNSEILDNDVNEKLFEVLGRVDIKLNIGEREIESLLGDKETFDRISERFPNLKNDMLKQINIYAIKLFESIAQKGKSDLSEISKQICKNYLKNYYKEGIELEIINDTGKKILKTIQKAKINSFVEEQYKEQAVWKKYRNAINLLLTKDISTLSKEEIIQYDDTLKFNFKNVIMGYTIPEAEIALKIIQREDFDIAKFNALDQFAQEYEKEINNPNSKKVRKDENFSIVLDYDILLKNKGIQKEGQYSPIAEMSQAIKEGTFGKDNILSKEETAFALKMLQNPELLDNEVKEKLFEVLGRADIKLNIGKREMEFLLRNGEKFDYSSETFSTFQEEVLKQIDGEIYSILEDIVNKNKKIEPSEMDKISKYFKDYFERSLDSHGDTIEMSKIFSLAMDIAYTGEYNLVELKNQKETIEFIEKEIEENEVFAKYDSKINEMASKLQSAQTITQEEFEKYDQIFYEYSFRTVLDNADNIKIIKALENRSKELQISSKTIENQIELYIFKCIKGDKVFRQQVFYETIIDYYERQMEGTSIQISENSAISHLIRAAQKGKLPKDLTTSILSKLEERKEHNLDLEISDTDNLDEYMQKVAEIRLQQGIMPKEYCYFIIKQAILQEKGMLKYNGIIERALEDFSEYELQDSKINNYYIAILNQPFLGGKNTNGAHNSDRKTIKLSRETLGLKGMFKLLETALHECTHAEQFNQIKNKQWSRDAYKMLKEEILRREKKNFYDDNYKHMYIEIDARKDGYVKRLQTLRKIGLTDSQIMELQAGNIKRTVADYCKEYKEGRVKKIGNETKDVNTLFLELLQEKPELLEKYPVLDIEFERKEDTVQRKSLANILETFEQKLSLSVDSKEKQRISSLFSEVLLHSGTITEERMQEELEQLIAFKTDNPIINAYKNKVLKTRFSEEIVMKSTMKKMYENHSEQDRIKLQQGVKKGLQEKGKQTSTQQEKNSEGRDE